MIASMVALRAAMETGKLTKTERIIARFKSIESSLAMMPASGKPLRSPYEGHYIGHDSVVVRGEHFAGTAESVWISSQISTMPNVADIPHPQKE